MTSPRAKRGRTYASERYPWTQRDWAEEMPDGGVKFCAEFNIFHGRDMRMIARRRLV